MSLSDKTEEVEDRKGFEYSVIPTEDVKEFIKELKESFNSYNFSIDENTEQELKGFIDKLAGEELL